MTEQKTTNLNLEKLQTKCDPRVFDVFVKLCGKHADRNAKEALELYVKNHCMMERAMADVLDKYTNKR